jgi:hypothetical protein
VCKSDISRAFYANRAIKKPLTGSGLIQTGLTLTLLTVDPSLLIPLHCPPDAIDAPDTPDAIDELDALDELDELLIRSRYPPAGLFTLLNF